jgi:hypothetical protein
MATLYMVDVVPRRDRLDDGAPELAGLIFGLMIVVMCLSVAWALRPFKAGGK